MMGVNVGITCHMTTVEKKKKPKKKNAPQKKNRRGRLPSKSIKNELCMFRS